MHQSCLSLLRTCKALFAGISGFLRFFARQKCFSLFCRCIEIFWRTCKALFAGISGCLRISVRQKCFSLFCRCVVILCCEKGLFGRYLLAHTQMSDVHGSCCGFIGLFCGLHACAQTHTCTRAIAQRQNERKRGREREGERERERETHIHAQSHTRVSRHILLFNFF